MLSRSLSLSYPLFSLLLSENKYKTRLPDAHTLFRTLYSEFLATEKVRNNEDDDDNDDDNNPTVTIL